KQRAIDPWTRATMLAPNFHYAMLATTLGDQDMTLLSAMFVKPDSALVMSFGDEPTPGLSCMEFSGSATAMPLTVSFTVPTQTAALQR
ncbi:MAG: ATP-binding protein, partial [Bradyrhizobium sp.]|nr:ATP-binding protein [Bradyrhizobium sp.]